MAGIIRRIRDLALGALALPFLLVGLAALVIVLAVGLYVRAIFVVILALGDGLPDRWAASVPAWRLGGRAT
jgi:hypothetical protein